MSTPEQPEGSVPADRETGADTPLTAPALRSPPSAEALAEDPLGLGRPQGPAAPDGAPGGDAAATSLSARPEPANVPSPLDGGTPQTTGTSALASLDEATPTRGGLLEVSTVAEQAGSPVPAHGSGVEPTLVAPAAQAPGATPPALDTLAGAPAPPRPDAPVAGSKPSPQARARRSVLEVLEGPRTGQRWLLEILIALVLTLVGGLLVFVLLG
jgi:hypothetical protein